MQTAKREQNKMFRRIAGKSNIQFGTLADVMESMKSGV